jgi:hypothetical protein
MSSECAFRATKHLGSHHSNICSGIALGVGYGDLTIKWTPKRWRVCEPVIAPENAT